MSGREEAAAERRAAVLQQHVSPAVRGAPTPTRYLPLPTPAGPSFGGQPLRLGTAPPATSASAHRQPPQLPARPASTLSGLPTGPYGGYGTLGGPASLYNSSYSRFGGMYNNPINRYGGMYGNMGGMYGNTGGLYGMSPSYQNNGTDLTQVAFDNSRPAFDAILSVIHAFGSVSTMLESMFDAVYSSFRAVLGAADQFHQMKVTFTDIYTSFALFRLLRYLYNKLLILLRVKKEDDFTDNIAWSEAGKLSTGTNYEGEPRKSHWPVVIFAAIAVGGPYLVYKTLSHFLVNSTQEIERGLRENESSIVLKALYDFQAQRSDELSFRSGDVLLISPSQLQNRVGGGINPWAKAMLSHNGSLGLIPMNYVTAIGRNNAATQQRIGQAAASNPHADGLPATWNNQQQADIAVQNVGDRPTVEQRVAWEQSEMPNQPAKTVDDSKVDDAGGDESY